MEDITYSLAELLESKTGMKPTSMEKITDPLTKENVVLIVFENGTRAYAKMTLKLQANGPLVKA